MSEPFVLAPESIEAIAQRLAGLLREPESRADRWVDAATLADELGMSRDWVYEHADELGGRRLGDGPKPRLRFDLDQARSAWTVCQASERSPTEKKPAPARERPRRPKRRTSSVPGLLPIKSKGWYA